MQQALKNASTTFTFRLDNSTFMWMQKAMKTLNMAVYAACVLGLKVLLNLVEALFTRGCIIRLSETKYSIF